jgi:uncharacterized protein (DUF488 family)
LPDGPDSTSIVAVPGRIYSVGYEGLELPGLVDRLLSAGVSLLVDVRLNPISRKPGFSKKRLTAALDEVGIEYRHESALGNPRENRAAFQNGNEQAAQRRVRRMLKNGSAPALQRLVDDARQRRVAVLCLERGELQCHRKVITDMAQEMDPSIEVLQVP